MRRTKLQRRLFLLAAAAIIPLAIISGIGLFMLVQQQRTQTDRAALEISRALLTAVDLELGQSAGVLQAMTQSALIDARNFRAFHDFGNRIVNMQPNWIGVTLWTLDGKGVLNTRLPYGSQGVPVVEPASFAEVVRAGKPTIGYLANRAGLKAFPIRVPITRDGKMLYILTATVKPESIFDVVQRQRFPQDWVISVYDANNVRVARSRAHDQYLGLPASPEIQRLMSQGTEGTGVTHTLEGADVFTAYSKSPYTGWSVTLGLPPAFMDTGVQHSLFVFGGGVTLSIILALLAALYMARRINQPMSDLTAAAQALGRGDTPAPTDTDVEEIHQVAQALRIASAERKRNEAEREDLLTREQEARAVAESANRAKDEFLAMLGHELRNPLGAISNAARLLDHPATNEDQSKRARGVIGRQVDHLARMTDDLLDAARATTGKIALHKQPIDLAATAATIVATFKLRTERLQIVQELEPAWTDADPTRMEQIISNLLENALKYTPAGGTVRVTVRKENGYAVLRVADNGIGMAPELAARVFDLFVQGTRDLDRSAGGLGIGLTLVRRLTELHGGTVEAKSAGPEQGSEFIVRLPSIPATGVGKLTVVEPQPAVARDVLVVEDNEDLRESLRALLELSGHHVRTAADGAEGLEAILAAPPDIAFIDVGLPKMDGYELVRRVRETLKDKPLPMLVALTGYGRPEDRAHALSAGFDTHMVKPIDQAVLQAVLSKTEPPTRKRRA